MDYQELQRTIQNAHDLIQSGKLKEIEAILFPLILSDISELDKAGIFGLMASVYDRMGDTEEALAWFDKGIACEQPYCRFEIEEKKAEYLSQLGRHPEAIKIYEQLLTQPYLTESDKERMRKLVQAELGKSLSTWR